MKRILIRLAVCFGILGLIALVFLIPLFSTAGPHWSSITEPAKLRHEATLLCQADYSGSVPRNAWPAAITALHPRAVFAGRQSVTVMISGGGISASPWGYIIWPDTVQRADGGITKYDSARDNH